MDDTTESRISLGLLIPADAHGCVRSRCPRCDLVFKVSSPEQLNSDALAEAVGRIQREHEPLATGSPAQARSPLNCPYCGHQGAGQDFLHPEHWGYMEQLLLREYAEPVFSKVLEEAIGDFPAAGL